MFDSLQLHELQHARIPCPSPTPRVHPNSYPSSRWCNPAISSSVFPFSSCPESLSASGSFPVSQLVTWGGQSIGVSASPSVLPINTLVIYLWPKYGEGNEDNGDLLQKVPCMHCYTQCSQPCSRPAPTHASAGHSLASLGQSLVGLLLLSPCSWCTQVSVCAFQESVSPVLCKFWWLYGVVNGDLLQEGLCHTQVCCTQSPCPCGSPLLTCTSIGDTQTQFCPSVCGGSGSWCAQGLFEPSERLCWLWSLILNAISSFLPSSWGFSVLRCGVSPHSCSSAMQLLLQHCTAATPVLHI